MRNGNRWRIFGHAILNLRGQRYQFPEKDSFKKFLPFHCLRNEVERNASHLCDLKMKSEGIRKFCFKWFVAILNDMHYPLKIFFGHLGS